MADTTEGLVLIPYDGVIISNTEYFELLER